jgi:hypothetical protein
VPDKPSVLAAKTEPRLLQNEPDLQNLFTCDLVTSNRLKPQQQSAHTNAVVDFVNRIPVINPGNAGIVPCSAIMRM